MNPTSSQPRKAPPPPRPAGSGGAKPAGDVKQWLTRLSFSAPIFGMGEYSWTFLCDAAMAEEIQAALLDKRSIRLEFPKNTVVLDASQVVLADFQPHA